MKLEAKEMSKEELKNYAYCDQFKKLRQHIFFLEQQLAAERAQTVELESRLQTLQEFHAASEQHRKKLIEECDRYKALLKSRPKFYGWREFPNDVPYTAGNEENKRQFDKWDAEVTAATSFEKNNTVTIKDKK